jgi:hypothetical protein
MTETASLDFRFYDRYDGDDVNIIYIDEENPSSIFLKFEIQNNTGVNLVLNPYIKPEKNENLDLTNIVSSDNFHIELRFRPGVLSSASLVQIDLGENSKEKWMMSRPVFHENKEISLYFLRHREPLHLSKTLGLDSNKTSLTLRGFAANSAGGARGTNVIVNYDKFQTTDENFKLTNDKAPISAAKLISLTILSHRGERKAPLSICFATYDTILNNGESKGNDIQIQITNIGNESIALSPKSEFIIEIDGEAERKTIEIDGKMLENTEPWAVAKKDEVGNFNITIKDQIIMKEKDQSWFWDWEFSSIDKNLEEPRFTFRNIFRRIGSTSVLKSYQEYIEFPQKLEAKEISFTSHITKPLVAYPGTEWKTESCYSFCFETNGNLVLYKDAKNTRVIIWATGTKQADKLKFYPNGNLVLYYQEKPVWSTQTVFTNKSTGVYLQLREDGNLVIYHQENPKQVSFQTNTEGGKQSNLNAKEGWRKSNNDIDDKYQAQNRGVQGQPDHSFPPQEDLIFTLSNVKSSLASGQGQIRVYYKNIPGYADSYVVLNLYKTHLIERDKKIGIGKIPNTNLDVEGSISATEKLEVKNISATETITAKSFVGQGAVVIGMIVMWSGKENDLPSGWQICNGKKGTPDLRGRFIVGAGIGETSNEKKPEYTLYKPDEKGEPDTHFHKISSPSTPCSTNEAGKHEHKFPDKWYFRKDFTAALKMTGISSADFMNATGIDTASEDVKNNTTQGSGSHSHSFSIEIPQFNSGNSSGENRPRWYALCFIMYLGTIKNDH